MKVLYSTLAVAATLMATAATAEMIDNSELSLDPKVQTVQIREMIEDVFNPLETRLPGVVSKMMSIADCESYGGRDGVIMHIAPNGQIIKNSQTGRAKGVFQIVPNPHSRVAAEKGLDLNQVADQILYAKFLVEDRIRRRDGGPYSDWVCS